MRKPRLPDLPDTGRRYLENTQRARLASPGLERYRIAKDGKGSRVALAVVLVAALLAAMVLFAR